MKHVQRAIPVLILTLVAGAVAAEERALTGGGGAGFGGPLGAAVSGELLYGLRADVREDGERVRGAAGLLMQVQAGSGGGKLSLGVGGRARLEMEDFKGPLAGGLKLSLARTWGSPVGTRPGLTYLGPELDLSAMHVALTLGSLFRVGGGSGGGIVVFSWGLGVRF